MEKALHSLSAKSETAGAIRYALSRWRALTRYAEDGLLEIDNWAAERALRAVVLDGRTFYLPASTAVGNAPPPCTPYRIGKTQRARPGTLSPHRVRTDRRTSRAASKNCFPGTSPPLYRPNPLRPLRHTHEVPTKKVVGTS